MTSMSIRCDELKGILLALIPSRSGMKNTTNIPPVDSASRVGMRFSIGWLLGLEFYAEEELFGEC